MYDVIYITGDTVEVPHHLKAILNIKESEFKRTQGDRSSSVNHGPREQRSV